MTHTEVDYGPPELMAVAIARLIRDGEIVFFGVSSPLPLVGVTLAQQLHAPNATVLNIAGGVNAQPLRLTAATSAAGLAHGSASLFDNADIYDLIARGRVDTAFLGFGQMDRLGRVNTSVIGPHAQPKVRLPGGGGAAVILPLAKRVILWRAAHNRRVFVDHLDFVTATGNVDRVVTPLGVWQRQNGQLRVESLHPGVAFATLVEQTGFELNQTSAPTAPPPTELELATLRRIDPDRVRASEFSL